MAALACAGNWQPLQKLFELHRPCAARVFEGEARGARGQRHRWMLMPLPPVIRPGKNAVAGREISKDSWRPTNCSAPLSDSLQHRDCRLGLGLALQRNGGRNFNALARARGRHRVCYGTAWVARPRFVLLHMRTTTRAVALCLYFVLCSSWFSPRSGVRCLVSELASSRVNSENR